MSFVSVFYLLFLAFTATVYYLLPDKCRSLWLLAVSYFFYFTWQPVFLIVLLGVTFLSFIFGQKIDRTVDKAKKKSWLAASIIVLLLPLAFFKYYNFLDENLTRFLSLFALEYEALAQPYLVPLGISFFTFQAISYVIDIYRGYLKPESRIGKYAVYIAFFPTVLSGPIERAKTVLNQLENPVAFDYQNIRSGLQLILWGVFKKVVLANRMLDFIEKAYNQQQEFPGALIYLAIIFSGLQLFCDFSAYSDIAVGSARMFGIKLTKNFDDRVYAAPSLEIFWKGWHRSLTNWLRDYVFFPLSRRVKTNSRLYLNIIIVYLLVGLWHGATWGFLTWGLLNGLWIVAENASKAGRARLFSHLRIDSNGRFFHFAAWLLIFHAVVIFGVFFRTETPFQAFAFIENINNSNANLLAHPETKSCLIVIIFLVFMDWINRKIPKNANFDAFIGKQKIWFRWGIYLLLSEAILRYIYIFDNAAFAYFNF